LLISTTRGKKQSGTGPVPRWTRGEKLGKRISGRREKKKGWAGGQ